MVGDLPDVSVKGVPVASWVAFTSFPRARGLYCDCSCMHTLTAHSYIHRYNNYKSSSSLTRIPNNPF